MSSNSPNEYISKTENKLLEDEDKILAKYILDLKKEKTRDEALKNLYSYSSNIREKIALYLWYSGGTMAVILQELIKLYPYLPPYNSKRIPNEEYTKTIYIFFLFQALASNPKTKKELIESGILVYVFPFLSINSNSKNSHKIRVSALSMLHTLVEKFDIEIFNFLKQNQIIPTLLKIIIEGKELEKTIACHIISIIISNITGLEYICEVKERLQLLAYAFGQILISRDGLKLKKMALKILLNLTQNIEAKNTIKIYLLKILKTYNFFQNLDESTKIKAKQLEKILQEDDIGLLTNTNDSKIQKLKSDLNANTNINNGNNLKNKKAEGNNLYNLNLTGSHSFNGYNNGNQKQMNINSNEFNNNKLNLNMMFINNMNQIKVPNGNMMPQVGEYNLNKDNEGYINPNMFNNQNGNAGYGNMYFYNTYKNI